MEALSLQVLMGETDRSRHVYLYELHQHRDLEPSSHRARRQFYASFGALHWRPFPDRQRLKFCR